MEQNFDCVPCGFTSTNRYNYDIHVNTVKHKARMEGLKCEQCGALYDSRNKLTRHKKNVHIKKEKRISEYLAAVEKAGTETKENGQPLSIAPLSIAPLSIAPLSIAPLSIAPLSIAPLSIASESIAPACVGGETNEKKEETIVVKPIIVKRLPQINIRPRLSVLNIGTQGDQQLLEAPLRQIAGFESHIPKKIVVIVPKK